MSNPLVDLIEKDPMFRMEFLDYDSQVPFWVNLVYNIRLFLGF